MDGDAQRIGQLGWMVFYKIFSDQDAELELNDDNYDSPLPLDLRWDEWADSKKLGEKVFDPACGTGGFLTCAYEYLKKQANSPEQIERMRRGWH